MSKGTVFLLLFQVCLIKFTTGLTEDFNKLSNENNRTDDICLDGFCEKSSLEHNATDIGLVTNALPQDVTNAIEVIVEREDSKEIANWEPICPTDVECNTLPADCIICRFNYTCVYGHAVNVTCQARQKCKGPNKFERLMTCQYCYQTAPEDHLCLTKSYCNSAEYPVQKYISNCTVKPQVLCLGQRKFLKNIRCNWTSGYKWSTTLILSITLGGFGADRFYLGHWQEGIGKLFSFGGAGVWTLIDVILVAVGYLKPADGSVYI